MGDSGRGQVVDTKEYRDLNLPKRELVGFIRCTLVFPRRVVRGDGYFGDSQ